MTEQPRDVRIGDAEREAAVLALGEHYGAGRLDATEHSERTDAAYLARTHADLDRLFGDLPVVGAAAPAQPRGARPGARRHGPVPAFAVLAIIALSVAFVAATGHPPVFLVPLAFIAWRTGWWQRGDAPWAQSRAARGRAAHGGAAR